MKLSSRKSCKELSSKTEPPTRKLVCSVNVSSLKETGLVHTQDRPQCFCVHQGCFNFFLIFSRAGDWYCQYVSVHPLPSGTPLPSVNRTFGSGVREMIIWYWQLRTWYLSHNTEALEVLESVRSMKHKYHFKALESAQVSFWYWGAHVTQCCEASSFLAVLRSLQAIYNAVIRDWCHSTQVFVGSNCI